MANSFYKMYPQGIMVAYGSSEHEDSTSIRGENYNHHDFLQGDLEKGMGHSFRLTNCFFRTLRKRKQRVVYGRSFQKCYHADFVSSTKAKIFAEGQ